MPMDGITIGAAIYELNCRLKGAKIEKVLQPEKDEIVLLMRNNGENYRLLLSANSSFPRVHITCESKPNPLSAPMFCMLLRKHLNSAKLTEIIQAGNERIATLTFDCTDEMGAPNTKKIIIEIMGKHSNIIFTNAENVILDSIKHVNSSISRVRQVLPGLAYEAPPSQGKIDPLDESSRSQIIEVLKNIENKSIPKLLTENFIGISTVAAREIEYNALTMGLESAFHHFMQSAIGKCYSPCLLLDENKIPTDFFPFHYNSFGGFQTKYYESISRALDDFYFLRDKAQRQKEKSRELHVKLSNLLEKCEKKKMQGLQKLKECGEMDTLRIYGELIVANLYKIKRGDSKVAANNYYSTENEEIEIPLDPALSPNANAQRYFKRYAKLKTAANLLTGQLEKNEDELGYIQNQLENLEKCTEVQELQEIRQELARLGYISITPPRKGEKVPESKPFHYISSDGIDIYVGKNNTQNDALTLHFAASDNMWLHTKNIHGSHVIIRYNGEPPKHTLHEAAMLAAYYSRARFSENVPVDAALRKYVKKPSGALPGKVIYTNNTTLYVTPDENSVLKMKKIN